MSSARDRMIAGELYSPLDPELVRARERAHASCQALNATADTAVEERRAILRTLFAAGGDDVWLQPPFFCDYGFNIRFGTGCFVNFNCVVLDVCPIVLGDRVLLGPAVQIYAAMHPMDAELRRTQEYGRPVHIGDDVWIGGGAIVCPGVTIGARSVIGAGSVVVRDVPPGVFAAGNPCRVVRTLPS